MAEAMGSRAPQVAAIVPTLDRALELESCLRSLGSAEPRYAEVIVADQGDDPSLESRVTAFGARYLHLDVRGLSRARNAAMALASAPWLHFPDDDCTVAPDVLTRIAGALTRHPNVGFIAARVLTPAGDPVMVGMDERERELRSPADTLATVMSPGLFIATRVFERCGGFDERFGVGAEWPSGEESDLLFRALAAGERGLYVPTAIVTHPDPFAARDETARRRRARLYGRGWGALFAKHAAAGDAQVFASLQRRYETRALGGAILSAVTLRAAHARRHWESWLGRREGWSGWRATMGRNA